MFREPYKQTEDLQANLKMYFAKALTFRVPVMLQMNECKLNFQ